MSQASVDDAIQGKVCVVTGATGGIGLVTARELARRGARVIGVGRSSVRCVEAAREIREQTGSPNIEFLLADLSSQRQVRQLADELRARTPRIDVLLNNAGGIYLNRVESVDGIEMTFAVNHIAYFLLTTLLMDLLSTGTPARIVSVASAAHQGAVMNFDDLQGKNRYSGWKAYQQSKLANLLFTYELNRRLAGTAVTANALHPGYVNTRIFKVAGVSGWLLRRAADLFAISPERGARTSIFLASSPAVEGLSGQYFAKQKAVPSSRASHDDASARRLWEVSEQLTGLGKSASS